MVQDVGNMFIKHYKKIMEGDLKILFFLKSIVILDKLKKIIYKK